MRKSVGSKPATSRSFGSLGYHVEVSFLTNLPQRSAYLPRKSLLGSTTGKAMTAGVVLKTNHLCLQFIKLNTKWSLINVDHRNQRQSVFPALFWGGDQKGFHIFQELSIGEFIPQSTQLLGDLFSITCKQLKL